MLIWAKEAREMFRDKRVIQAAFVAPIIMIVLFIFLFGFLETKLKRNPDIKLTVVRDETNQMLDQLEEAENISITQVDDVEAGLALLADNETRAVIEFSPNFADGMQHGDAVVTAHYDSDETLSLIAMSAVREMVEEMNKESVRATFVNSGLPERMAEPVTFEREDEKSGEGLGGSMLVSLLPYLIVLWAFIGGMSTVSDLVAGEKERGTLETLLISPVRRSQVVLGKFLSLSAVCFVSSLTTLVGVVIVGSFKFEMTEALFPDGLRLSLLAIVEIGAILIPLVMLFAGVMLSVSAFAKSVREAQTYLTLVSFLVIMPAIFSQFIGFTESQNALWVRLTPVLNSAIALKEALVGELEFVPFLMTVGVSLALAAAAIWASFWLFSREQILTRT